MQHVGCQVLKRDGILESLVDNFLKWVECTFRQEAQPGYRGSFTLVNFSSTPLKSVTAIEFILIKPTLVDFDTTPNRCKGN